MLAPVGASVASFWTLVLCSEGVSGFTVLHGGVDSVTSVTDILLGRSQGGSEQMVNAWWI